MQEGEHDALRASGLGFRERLRDRILGRRDLGPTIGVHALLERDHPVARDKWRRAAREQVVRVRDLQPRQFEHVAEAFRDKQAEPRACALDDAVDADRRAMGEIGHVPRGDAEAALDLVEAQQDLGAGRVRP